MKTLAYSSRSLIIRLLLVWRYYENKVYMGFPETVFAISIRIVFFCWYEDVNLDSEIHVFTGGAR